MYSCADGVKTGPKKSGQAALRRRTRPTATPPRTSSDNVLGSGTVAPFASKTTLSRPFELSPEGSPLRKSSVVEEPDAVKMVVNCCEGCVPKAAFLFVKEPSK